MNSEVSNMSLHCSSIAKIIPFKTFDGASFWVKNAKKIRFLAFERIDKNALILIKKITFALLSQIHNKFTGFSKKRKKKSSPCFSNTKNKKFHPIYHKLKKKNIYIYIYILLCFRTKTGVISTSTSYSNISLNFCVILWHN